MVNVTELIDDTDFGLEEDVGNGIDEADDTTLVWKESCFIGEFSTK